jgi:hypothetical protein
MGLAKIFEINAEFMEMPSEFISGLFDCIESFGHIDEKQWRTHSQIVPVTKNWKGKNGLLYYEASTKKGDVPWYMPGNEPKKKERGEGRSRPERDGGEQTFDV